MVTHVTFCGTNNFYDLSWLMPSGLQLDGFTTNNIALNFILKFLLLAP